MPPFDAAVVVTYAVAPAVSPGRCYQEEMPSHPGSPLPPTSYRSKMEKKEGDEGVTGQ